MKEREYGTAPSAARIASEPRWIPWWLVVASGLGLIAGCSPERPTLVDPDADAGENPGADAGANVELRCAPLISGPTITVDVTTTLGPLRSLQGFLNGIDPAPGSTATLDPTLVSELHPAFWRFGTGGGGVYSRLAPFGATMTFVLSDGYADLRGGYQNARPWEDWAGYENYLTSVVQSNVTAGRPLKYFDVWNEPQGGTKWLGTYDQLLELYARTFKIVRAIDPDAKLVGPSFDDFLGNIGGKGLGDILLDLDTRYGKRLDAISWHELGGQPVEDVPAHVALLRQALAMHLPSYTPEIHINEYSGPNQHLLPGWAVGWLHYLTLANVDVANRACWDVPGEGWSDCWAGMDGLLRPDNHTPQHTYWAHRLYAQLLGGQRLQTSTTDAHAVGIAVHVPGPDRLRVLTGRFVSTPPGPSAPVTLVLTGLPASVRSVDVASQLVPSTGIPGPLPSPVALGTCPAAVSGGQAAISVQGYPDGAAIHFEMTLVQ